MAPALGVRSLGRIGPRVDIQKVYLGLETLCGRSSGIVADQGLCADDTKANELPI
jgi:hypothetical protein